MGTPLALPPASALPRPAAAARPARRLASSPLTCAPAAPWPSKTPRSRASPPPALSCASHASWLGLSGPGVPGAANAGAGSAPALVAAA